MQDICVKTINDSYLITDKIDDLKAFVATKSKILILCDSNTKEHAIRVQNDLKCPSLLEVMTPGENTKSFQSIIFLLEKYSVEINRSSGIILVGGGMIGDLGALFSSLMFRGLDFYMVPTTLLSMVDSSIGGKTAVNLKTGKNLAGVFNNPSGVYINFDHLRTLPWIELVSGYGELLKSALIDSQVFFAKALSLSLKDYFESKSMNVEFSDLIYQSMLLKKRVVEKDPFEAGLRKVLNLGHTMSHAVESYSKYTIPHGVCVFYGLYLEAALGESLGYLDTKYASEILGKFKSLELPEFEGCWKDLESWLKVDKKNFDDNIQFVFMKKPGELFDPIKISTSVPLDQVFSNQGIFS